ncbi:hypothetical protein SUGI_0683960 [Cryptomeria japonica]|uniref:non-specific lipid transfer protein GPI-anchored 5 n=1 Tax=Cryptomeria japonica TaxID=3369 RepID=UPI002414CEB5|nr:non-specific lipid transfer protein GPI-anchored 5 [Cryptomeria japonica]GLJ34005.1 hypothetical protein SUGI_0683960 [Cryptomeria japonica]
MKGIHPSVFLVLIVVASITAAGNYRVVAQTPAALCITSLITLSPCTGYVTSNSSTTPPSPSCCSALSSVVQSSVVCLCQLFTSNNFLGISINQTRALALPKACNVSTPPLSRCQGITVNASAPSPSVDAPAPPPSIDAPAPSPSEGGGSAADAPTSESVPSPSPSITPSTPTVVSPSSGSPSAIPPPNSNGSGISPKGKNDPTTNEGAHFIPSIFINVFVMVIIEKFLL